MAICVQRHNLLDTWLVTGTQLAKLNSLLCFKVVFSTYFSRTELNKVYVTSFKLYKNFKTAQHTFYLNQPRTLWQLAIPYLQVCDTGFHLSFNVQVQTIHRATCSVNLAVDQSLPACLFCICQVECWGLEQRQNERSNETKQKICDWNKMTYNLLAGAEKTSILLLIAVKNERTTGENECCFQCLYPFMCSYHNKTFVENA